MVDFCFLMAKIHFLKFFPSHLKPHLEGISLFCFSMLMPTFVQSLVVLNQQLTACNVLIYWTF